MNDENSYKFAELNNQSEAVELIQRAEQQLTEQYGMPITLIAYEKKDEKESQQK